MKFNNDVLVVPNISFRDEKELRYNAMRPVGFDDTFGPRSQVEFTNVGGRPGGTKAYGIEGGIVQDVILFDDLGNKENRDVFKSSIFEYDLHLKFIIPSLKTQSLNFSRISAAVKGVAYILHFNSGQMCATAPI